MLGKFSLIYGGKGFVRCCNRLTAIHLNADSYEYSVRLLAEEAKSWLNVTIVCIVRHICLNLSLRGVPKG